MEVYKASNINGRFDHLLGKTAVLAYIRKVDGEQVRSISEGCKDYGWTVERVSRADARAVGFSV